MREAAMEQNENLKEAIANGDLSIGEDGNPTSTRKS